MFRSVVVAGVGVVVLWLMAGCTKRNPAVCCTTEEDCERSGLPTPTTCEDALVCLANSCQPPPTCQADSDCSGSLVCDVADGVCAECVDSSTCGDKVCDSSTHSCRQCEVDAECPGGFCLASTMTCRSSIVPSYVPDACDDTSESDLVIASDTSIDTSDATVCTGGVTTQLAPAPEICKLHYRTIFIQGGFALSIVGPRAVAIVADTNATIDGTFAIDAKHAVNGPGGGATVSGGEAQSGVGGGGAGFDTIGGSGGIMDKDGGANNAGDPVVYSPSAPLLGGPRAGGIGGGGGGGAATIIACRGRLSVTGVISANGGGGKAAPTGFGGSGGGAGGYVALQGRTVSMVGRAYANGGSASAGAPITNGLGGPGGDGLRSLTCVAGLHFAGSGGCRDVPPGDGGEGGGTAQVLSGGGGGSVGVFAAFTPVGGALVAPSEASPAFTHTNLIETR